MHKKIIIIGVALFLVSLLTMSILIYRAVSFSRAATMSPSPTPIRTLQTILATMTEFQKLALLIEDVRASSGFKYTAKDSNGNSLDAIKVIQPFAFRKYVGIYHTNVNGVFTVKIAESTDLLNWTYKGDIDTNATHADIMVFPEGDYLVTYEKFTSTSSGIRIRHYKNYESLLLGQYLSEKDLPRTLSRTNEGTPNFLSVNKKAFDKIHNTQDWTNSTIKLGFHYYDSVSDKNATGSLTSWKTWKSATNTMINNYFKSIGYTGNYGDRDDFKFKFTNSKYGTLDYNVYEAQITKDAWESWRSFLYDVKNGKIVQLDPYTHNRSIAFANPSVSNISLPDGTNGLFVSYYIFSEGAAPGEGGPLIFFTKESNLSKATLKENRDPFVPLPSPTPTSVLPSPTPTTTAQVPSPTTTGGIQPTSTPGPTGSQVTCTCTTPGGQMPNNGFTCTDGDSRYCSPDEYCTNSSVKPSWPCAKQ